MQDRREAGSTVQIAFRPHRVLQNQRWFPGTAVAIAQYVGLGDTKGTEPIL